MSLNINPIALDAHTQNMIELGQQQERNRWLAAVEDMIKDADYYEMHERVKWTLEELKARMEVK